jgi:hypothetical protein
MTSSEEFKQAIRAGNINEAFLVAMSNAPELNITTKIVTTDKTSQQAQTDNYLRTQINLIEGKIENEIGEQFTGDRYGEIKQFHIEQVTQGHQTIQHNLISLQRMFQLMSAFQQQQAAERLNWVEIAADVNQESLPTKSKVNQLSGNKAPEALAASTTNNQPATVSIDKPEPQLPGFEPEAEDDDVVDDLLSLADLDEQSETEVPTAEQGDWGEWLEEPEVKSEVFDLKTLNLRDNHQNWQHWNSQQHSSHPQPSQE